MEPTVEKILVFLQNMPGKNQQAKAGKLQGKKYCQHIPGFSFSPELLIKHSGGPDSLRIFDERTYPKFHRFRAILSH